EPLPFHQAVGVDITRRRLPVCVKINLRLRAYHRNPRTWAGVTLEVFPHLQGFGKGIRAIHRLARRQRVRGKEILSLQKYGVRKGYEKDEDRQHWPCPVPALKKALPCRTHRNSRQQRDRGQHQNEVVRAKIESWAHSYAGKEKETCKKPALSTGFMVPPESGETHSGDGPNPGGFYGFGGAPREGISTLCEPYD